MRLIEKLQNEVEKLKKHIKKTDKVVDYHTNELDTKVDVEEHHVIKDLIA